MVTLMFRRCLQLLIVVAVIVATVVLTAPQAEAFLGCAQVRRVPFKYADALDDQGNVGGFGNRTRAYVWNFNTDVTRWLGGIEGGLASNVSDISPDGRWLAGWAEVASALTPWQTRHNGWRRGPNDTRLVPVPTPPGFASELKFVTNDGLAAGDLTNLATGTQRPFLWTPDGQFINLLWPQPFTTGTVMDLHGDGAILVSATASTARTLEWKAPYSNYPSYPPVDPPARFFQSSDTVVGRVAGGDIGIYRLNSTSPQLPTFLHGLAPLGEVGDVDQTEGRITGGGPAGAWAWDFGDPEVTFITTAPISGARVGRDINRHGDVLIQPDTGDYLIWDREECPS